MTWKTEDMQDLIWLAAIAGLSSLGFLYLRLAEKA
jgi:hypothetical protein